MEEVKKVGLELGKATTECIKTCSTLESYEKSTHKLGNTFIYICHVQSAELGDKPEERQRVIVWLRILEELNWLILVIRKIGN